MENAITKQKTEGNIREVLMFYLFLRYVNVKNFHLNLSSLSGIFCSLFTFFYFNGYVRYAFSNIDSHLLVESKLLIPSNTCTI